MNVTLVHSDVHLLTFTGIRVGPGELLIVTKVMKWDKGGARYG